jgi:DNA-binding transcriptional LysR family regulator
MRSKQFGAFARSGERGLDLVLTLQPDHRIRTLTWTPLIRSSWHLVVSREHPLAAQSKVSPAEVAREPLLAFNRRDYPEYWEMIAGWLRKHRQNGRLAGEYDSLSSLTAAIAAGMGVAVILSRVARVLPKSVVLKELSAEPKPLTIGVGHRKDRAREKSVARFIKELRTAVS